MALPFIWNGWDVWEGDELDQAFRLVLNGAAEDLSLTPVVTAQVRALHDDTAPMASFTCTMLDQTVLATRGRIRLFLPILEADKLVAGVAYWDVQLAKADGTGRRTRIAGKMKIRNQVTR